MAYEITKERCAEHLAGIVRFPTVSYDDESLMDFGVFEAMHAYLKEAYPLVHKTLELEIVGKAGLLYHWKGTGKSKNKPLLFMAHQDVVPEGDHSKWVYPPYSGTIADGYVWGRGASDCKSTIIAPLEAIEHLISVGFTPDFDVYLAFGYNEEVGSGLGEKSAAWMAGKLLEDRGVKVGAIFDEGGGVGIDPILGPDTPACTITLGEKGYADFEISRIDAGGHSAMPGKEGALWYVAKAILAIEENPFPYRLIDVARRKYKVLAPYFKDEKMRELFSDMDAHWEELLPIIDADRKLAPMFHTTLAVTQAAGSVKSNILPEKASIIVNSRLLPGDTLDDVKKYLESIVPDGMEVTLLRGNEASPVSDYETPIKDLVVDISNKRSGGCVAVPDLSVGGTDAKYMYGLTNNVYRFGPFIRTADIKPSNAHSVNETMSVDLLADAPYYYMELFRRYTEIEA